MIVGSVASFGTAFVTSRFKWSYFGMPSPQVQKTSNQCQNYDVLVARRRTKGVLVGRQSCDSTQPARPKDIRLTQVRDNNRQNHKIAAETNLYPEL
jgi:hypothetical protein